MKVSPRAIPAGDDGESHVSEVLRAPRESGIAPAGHSADFLAIEEVDRRGQLALANTARIEGNLSMLLRGIEHLGAGVYAAREANRDLAQELDAALEALERTRAEEAALRARILELEDALEAKEGAAALERQRFIQQEDAFLYELIDDHERELGALAEQLARLTSETDADFVGEEERPTLRPAKPPAAPSATGGDSALEEAASIGALKLRSVQIELPAVSEVQGREPEVASGERPSGLRPRSPSSAYSLRSGEVADEYVDITRVKSKARSDG